MEFNFETGAWLLLIAAVVAILTRRLRLPYSVGLVVAGIILVISPFAPKVSLAKDLIFTVLLPPLLFEAAFYLHWNQLRRNFPVIVVLATLGVLLSAGVTAAGMHYLNASAEQLYAKLLPGFSPRRLRTNSWWLSEGQGQSIAHETYREKNGLTFVCRLLAHTTISGSLHVCDNL